MTGAPSTHPADLRTPISRLRRAERGRLMGRSIIVVATAVLFTVLAVRLIGLGFGIGTGLMSLAAVAAWVTATRSARRAWDEIDRRVHTLSEPQADRSGLWGVRNPPASEPVRSTDVATGRWPYRRQRVRPPHPPTSPGERNGQ